MKTVSTVHRWTTYPLQFAYDEGSGLAEVMWDSNGSNACVGPDTLHALAETLREVIKTIEELRETK